MSSVESDVSCSPSDVSCSPLSSSPSEKHVSFSVEDEEHMMKLEQLCARLNTDCFYGLTSKHAKLLVKKYGMNKYSRPGTEEKRSLVGKFLGHNKKSEGTNAEWSKRDWNRVFNGRVDDIYIVVRDAKKTIVRRSAIVRGDLIYLQPRQIVPADMRVISYEGELVVDNRIITGSHQEFKSTSPTSHDPLLSQNMIFANTEILDGLCEAIVLRTGDDTVFGELTQFATKVRYVKRQHSASFHSSGQSSSGSTVSSLGALSMPSSLNLSMGSSINSSASSSSAIELSH